MSDTICAIATSLGTSGISIIKVSGPDSIKIVESVFSGKISNVPSHSIKYGYIVDKNIKIDEVLLSIMLAPKTYTKEDIVEINCHGGIVITNKILTLLLNNGCRLAEPGEFTKRAYLNGRIDLIEAEAVSEMINAETDNANKLAINQIQGKLSNKIKELRKEILSILGNIEVNIDYPEYDDIEIMTNKIIKPKLQKIQKTTKKMLAESVTAKIIKKGIDVAIIGKPNVGKSSILNFLLDESKAIVTDIAGTTRDIVEGTIVLDGIMINLYDTAGIRETDDYIEKIGVDKSIDILKNSDLIIFVLNNNEVLSIDDIEILEMIKTKKSIIFINKSDLEQKLSTEIIKDSEYIYGNTVEDNGLEALKQKIIEMFNLEKITTKDPNYLSNARQVSIMEQVNQTILELINNIDNLSIDLIAIDIKKVWDLLGEIIGETYKSELLDEIFSNFCLGK